MSGIRDIAKITGLSLATVSRVFNNSPAVSPKTRAKVLKAAKEIDYQPNMMAAALRSGKSKIIGVLVPEVNNFFFSSIINGIEKKLADLGYKIIIAQSHESFEKEQSAIQSFVNLKVDGILLSLSKETSNYTQFKKVIKNKTPMVFFDRVPDSEEFNTVTLDDHYGAYIATEHLIKSGCKQLIHILGDPSVSIFSKRKNGFLAALRNYQYQIEPRNMVSLYYNQKKDSTLLKNLLRVNPKIDGIFAYGDETCLYLLNIMSSLSVEVPKQVKVIGFGNANYSSLIQPALSSIDQKCNEMGERAATMLVNSLHDPSSNAIVKDILSPKLIVRGSTT